MSITRKYNVTFAKAPEYNATWSFELTESGAFSYGNGTCVIIRENGKVREVVDTRYEKGILQDFAAWCEDFTRSNFNPELEPTFEFVSET